MEILTRLNRASNEGALGQDSHGVLQMFFSLTLCNLPGRRHSYRLCTVMGDLERLSSSAERLWHTGVFPKKGVSSMLKIPGAVFWNTNLRPGPAESNDGYRSGLRSEDPNLVCILVES
jgi:hypothetical protein